MSDQNEFTNNDVDNNVEHIEAEITSSEDNSKKNMNTRKAFWSGIIDYVELFTIAISVVIVLFSGVFRTCTVDGDSMNKTLINGEVLIVSDFMYEPQREDIIVFHQTGKKNMPLVKRVIGVGGDTVTIDFDTWDISVEDKNGKNIKLDESYIYLDPTLRHYLEGTHIFKVPEGSLFVLGDNRNNSMDSTDKEHVGFVDCRRVIGKVVLRVTPFDKFGAID